MRIADYRENASVRTIVDREKGQYLGHPTTALLKDGKTILCVYPLAHGRGAIQYKKSLDGGRTWSERLPVPESFATSLECPILYRVTDEKLLLFSGMYPARIAKSYDEGMTWTELEPVGDFGGIVFASDLYRKKDGALLAVFHDDGRYIKKEPIESGFVVYGILSYDDGETWGDPIPLISHPDADLCEPCIIPSPDGKKLLMLMRENSRKHNSFVCESDDDGATWHFLRELPLSLTGDRHTAKFMHNGDLFISFRDMAKGSPTNGSWVVWVGSFEDILYGRDGKLKLLLMENHYTWGDCAYPGVEVLPEGIVVTTTYGHWVEGEEPFIVSIRLSESEIQAQY